MSETQYSRTFAEQGTKKKNVLFPLRSFLLHVLSKCLLDCKHYFYNKKIPRKQSPSCFLFPGLEYKKDYGI